MLSVYENEIDQTIEETKSIPSELAYNGSISLTKEEICKNIGSIIIKRSSVNLHSDMLDTPEIFWEYEEWEPIYRKMRKYLDMDRRLEALNKRLDVLKELYDMLNLESKNSYRHYLEWIVMILIIIQIFIELWWIILFKAILKLIY